MKMKTNQLSILAILVALLVPFSAADYQEIVNDVCRWRVATIPHPNPVLCHLFVQCQLLAADIRECPAGQIFVENDLCVPGNRETCQRDVPTPPVQTVPPVTSTTTPILDNVCVGITIGFIEHPFTCLAFIFCFEENYEVINCPNQTPVFDPSRTQCVAGNPDTCEIFGPSPPPTNPPTPPITGPPITIPPITLPPITVTLPPITLTPPATTPPTSPPTFPPIGPTPTNEPPVLPPFELCRGNNSRFVADPTSCYRYYYCLLGVPLPGECDSDRIFHVFLDRIGGCVVGNRETCTRTLETNIDDGEPSSN